MRVFHVALDCGNWSGCCVRLGLVEGRLCSPCMMTVSLTEKTPKNPSQHCDSNNINYDNVYGAVIVTKVIARVHPFQSSSGK